MNSELPPELVKALPGTLGSLFSMLWIKETWPRRLVMFFAGAVLSRFGTYNVSAWSGLDIGFTGFLLGLFGMAIVAKIFDIWLRFDMAPVLGEWVRKRLGLPAKEA